jgi:murein DD-endopeptidase MepM/ murein hydrolase activator NlpD
MESGVSRRLRHVMTLLFIFSFLSPLVAMTTAQEATPDAPPAEEIIPLPNEVREPTESASVPTEPAEPAEAPVVEEPTLEPVTPTEPDISPADEGAPAIPANAESQKPSGVSVSIGSVNLTCEGLLTFSYISTVSIENSFETVLLDGDPEVPGSEVIRTDNVEQRRQLAPLTAGEHVQIVQFDVHPAAYGTLFALLTWDTNGSSEGQGQSVVSNLECDTSTGSDILGSTIEATEPQLPATPDAPAPDPAPVQGPATPAVQVPASTPVLESATPVAAQRVLSVTAITDGREPTSPPQIVRLPFDRAYPISQMPGMNRECSISHFKGNGVLNERAIDFSTPRNTSVRAVAAGEVVFADVLDYSSGFAIIIDHGDGLYTAYLHLDRADPVNGRVGMRVKAGDVIAVSGNSGFKDPEKTQPNDIHLHLAAVHYGNSEGLRDRELANAITSDGESVEINGIPGLGWNLDPRGLDPHGFGYIFNSEGYVDRCTERDITSTTFIGEAVGQPADWSPPPVNPPIDPVTPTVPSLPFTLVLSVTEASVGDAVEFEITGFGSEDTVSLWLIEPGLSIRKIAGGFTTSNDGSLSSSFVAPSAFSSSVTIEARGSSGLAARVNLVLRSAEVPDDPGYEASLTFLVDEASVGDAVEFEITGFGSEDTVSLWLMEPGLSSRMIADDFTTANDGSLSSSFIAPSTFSTSVMIEARGRSGIKSRTGLTVVQQTIPVEYGLDSIITLPEGVHTHTSSLAINPDGTLLVITLDEHGGTVLAAYSPDGELLRELDRAMPNEQFVGVSVAANGNIHLAIETDPYSMTWRTVIETYDSNYSRLRTYDAPYFGHSVAVAPDGTIYVSSGATYIGVTSRPGVYKITPSPIGGLGEVILQERIAPDLAVDFQGNLFVRVDNYLKKYSSEGQLLAEVDIEQHGGGIAVDEFGNVYTTSAHEARKYSNDLKPLGTWPVWEEGSQGDLNKVLVDSDGRVYVFDGHPSVEMHVYSPTQFERSVALTLDLCGAIACNSNTDVDGLTATWVVTRNDEQQGFMSLQQSPMSSTTVTALIVNGVATGYSAPLPIGSYDICLDPVCARQTARCGCPVIRCVKARNSFRKESIFHRTRSPSMSH